MDPEVSCTLTALSWRNGISLSASPRQLQKAPVSSSKILQRMSKDRGTYKILRRFFEQPVGKKKPVYYDQGPVFVSIRPRDRR